MLDILWFRAMNKRHLLASVSKTNHQFLSVVTWKKKLQLRRDGAKMKVLNLKPRNSDNSENKLKNFAIFANLPAKKSRQTVFIYKCCPLFFLKNSISAFWYPARVSGKRVLDHKRVSPCMVSRIWNFPSSRYVIETVRFIRINVLDYLEIKHCIC